VINRQEEVVTATKVKGLMVDGVGFVVVIILYWLIRCRWVRHE
jgi:hypothetical protein